MKGSWILLGNQNLAQHLQTQSEDENHVDLLGGEISQDFITSFYHLENYNTLRKGHMMSMPGILT